MKNKRLKWFLTACGLLIAAVAAGIFSLCTGSVNIPLEKIPGFLFRDIAGSERSILFNIRLPRIILGFAVGGSLSLAGALLQGLFRNPLVEPYTLGISGGAALGVSLCIVLKISGNLFALPASGFAGAVIIVITVYAFSIRRGFVKIQNLLLTGVMISFVSSSLLMLILSVSRSEELHAIIFWIMGSLEEPNFLLVMVMAVTALAALVLSYFFARDLNALALGEEEASHLGVDTKRSRQWVFLLSSLLTGVSVSLSGIIGFVGLVVPHFMRLFFGGDYRILLVSSFLGGAAFLVLCDTAARTVIAPLELPVGVITGIIGGILFIFALSRKKAAL